MRNAFRITLSYAAMDTQKVMRDKVTQRDNSDPHWRMAERTVAILEKFLTPGAVVTHNEELPELATGTMRQCDVVVRSGRPPRQTLTIVEVQDRSRKVELGTYEGWCLKRRKLGVQHLICVSASGFPESVQKDASLRGDTVRLITLTEPEEFPHFFQARHIRLEMLVTADRDVNLVFDKALPTGGVNYRCDAKVFEVEESSKLRSITEIIDRACLAGQALDFQTLQVSEARQQRSCRLSFEQAPWRVWCPQGELRIPIVEALVTEIVERHSYQIPLRMMAYEQIGYRETLAWILMATGTHEEHELSIRIPLARNKDGQTRIGQIEISNLPRHTWLSQSTELAVLREVPKD